MSVGAGRVFGVRIEAQQVEHLNRRIAGYFLAERFQVAGTGI